MSKRYGLVIDLERCIGCHTCTISCKFENNIEKGSGIRVETVGGPQVDTPKGIFPNLTMHYLPIPCMHCKEPPCLEACPVEAITKRDDGIVLIDEDKCDGCQTCISACPYGTIIFDDENDVAVKCSLCSHRIDEGQDPFCVVCCETEAMYFGDLDDRNSNVSKIISTSNAKPLVKGSDTGPTVYYIPTRKGKIS